MLLVDGLGWQLLRIGADAAPYLSAHAAPTILDVGFPSTTATSLGSLGTGLAVGAHGLLGYELVAPDGLGVLNLLRWDDRPDPLAFQPAPTVFERVAAARVPVTRVLPARFATSGLTRAALRGGAFVPADTHGERVAAVVAALASVPSALVYAYDGGLDATGHRHGCGSPAWRHELAHVDRMVEQLAANLPAGSTLVVTGDHGMVDVPAAARVDVGADAELADGVRLVVGEPRARYLHTLPGADDDVLACWRERLGARASVYARDEAIAAGLFGPVRGPHRARIGDVVVVARDDLAVVDSRTMPPELLALVGMHGARSDAERLVPLLVVRR